MVKKTRFILHEVENSNNALSLLRELTNKFQDVVTGSLILLNSHISKEVQTDFDTIVNDLENNAFSPHPRHMVRS